MMAVNCLAGWRAARRHQGNAQLLGPLPGRIRQRDPWPDFQLLHAAGGQVFNITPRVKDSHAAYHFPRPGSASIALTAASRACRTSASVPERYSRPERPRAL